MAPELQRAAPTGTPLVRAIVRAIDLEARIAAQSAYREIDGQDYMILWPSSLTKFSVL
jgi:hypothetical protein